MSTKLPAQAERIPLLPVWLNIGFAASIACVISLWIAFHLLPVTGWFEDHSFVASPDWLWSFVRQAFERTLDSYRPLDHLGSPHKSVLTFYGFLNEYDLRTLLLWRTGIVLGTTLVAALLAALYAKACLEPVSLLKHIKGRQLFRGRKAVSEAGKRYRKDVRKSGKGIELAPGITISDETETRHTLLSGATGSGKSQIMRYWIDQTIIQGSKLVLHDTKGDITSSLPDDNFILLAPHDERSWGWDIAKDCQGIAAARELASRLIPEGKEAMWSNGSREILTGIIRSLQGLYGNTWSWSDLRDVAFSNALELQELLQNAHPEGAKYIEFNEETGLASKTTFSFLVSMWSAVGMIVCPLADAWSETPIDMKISQTTDKPRLFWRGFVFWEPFMFKRSYGSRLGFGFSRLSKCSTEALIAIL